ncbi:MAG: nitrous oxide-stimulated promoter family protein [Spirochaetota bacterium]
MTRLQREERTVSAMIALYCRGVHKRSTPCADCIALSAYAQDRLSACPFGKEKPTCVGCTTHCYRRDMREKIRIIMRYAGPRMLFVHPILAIRHIIDRRAGRTRKKRYAKLS